ncbi:hypothetical protein P4110_14050 [Pseudomonas aeruginosa]|nr:hypothetical protein [Pseudomonas aeruginosa]
MNRFSLPRPDAHQCVAGLGFSALLLLASSANAAACRDITSVQQSADATRNTSMGGHVTQHIYGMTPPSGSSQKDKTLFKSRGNYDAAWRQYGYIDNPVACSGNSKFRVVSRRSCTWARSMPTPASRPTARASARAGIRTWPRRFRTVSS